MSSRYFNSQKIFVSIKQKWYGTSLPQTKIFRNVQKFEEKYGIIRQYKRKVKRQMFYTMIIDNMIKNNIQGWGGFPLRTKSICCNIEYNNDFYGNITLRVFPKPGTMIGICPNSDIWQTFDTSIRRYFQKPYVSFLGLMDIYFLIFKHLKHQPRESNIKQVKSSLEKLNQDQIRQLQEYLLSKYQDINYKRTVKLLCRQRKGFLLNLTDQISKLMNADYNKFLKIKYSPQLNLQNYSFCQLWCQEALLQKLDQQ